MKNHDFIEEIARQLDIDFSEAEPLVRSFLSALVTEILAVRTLSIKGLGSFTVTHVPLQKKSTGPSVVYRPPMNRLIYSSRLSGVDDTFRIAASRLSMSQGDARRFAQTLGSLFGCAVQRQQVIVFNGFGRFSLDDGIYVFFPDPSLEELLNREYHDLKEVVIPRQGSLPVGGERSQHRYLLPLSIVIVSGLLIAFFSFQSPDAILSILTPSKQSENPRPVSVPAASPNVAVQSALHRRAAEADSIVLEKGDYTIVLATYRLERTAIKERQPLRSAGITAYIWPAMLNGERCYRLMTGRFSGYSAAAARLKGLPGNIAAGAYVQEVIKRVVLYGK